VCDASVTLTGSSGQQLSIKQHHWWPIPPDSLFQTH